MYSTFSAPKTCQKRLRVPSDLDSAVSLRGANRKICEQMEPFQSARDSKDELRHVELIAGAHLVLSGSGWRSCERADEDVGVRGGGGHRKKFVPLSLG